MMEVSGNFSLTLVAHPGQVGAGFIAAENGMGAKERQGEAQVAGKGGKTRQQAHIAHSAPRRRILPRKKPFFFHIKADNDVKRSAGILLCN